MNPNLSKIEYTDNLIAVTQYQFKDQNNRCVYPEQKCKRGESPYYLEHVKAGVGRAKRTITMLAYSNFKESPFTKFLTLTIDKNKAERYSVVEGMRLVRNFEKQVQRYYPNSPYIIVPEPHEDGALHYHVLILLPYMNQNKLNRLWRYGFTKIRRVNSVSNALSYISKYMEKSMYDDRFVGRRRYFCSVGLKRPEQLMDEVKKYGVLSVLKGCSPVVSYKYCHPKSRVGDIVFKIYLLNSQMLINGLNNYGNN